MPKILVLLQKSESPESPLAIAQSDNQVGSDDGAVIDDNDSEDTVLMGKAVFPPTTATPSPLSFESEGGKSASTPQSTR